MTALDDYATAGIYDDLPAELYHLDPCAEPSLSASIAHKMITRSPLHAHHAHPRLNESHVEKASGIMDFGTAAHSLLLQGIDVCEIVDANDWRTKAAQEARDAARQTGMVPLLRKDWQRMCELVQAVADQLRGLDVSPKPLRDGKPEQTLIWQEDGLWCRARIDWLHNSQRHIHDLKTTGTSANPRDWAKNRLFADGKDLQAAFYMRGLRAVTGLSAEWRFVVVETAAPYALSVISLAPHALELANRKVDRALQLWRRCLESGAWPGYPQQVAYAEPPPWAEAEFLEAHYEEVAA